VGGESHRGKSRSPVARVASVEETKRRKPTDKAVLGAVSELPGRNESEPTGGLDRITPKAEPSMVGRRLQGMSQTDWRDMALRRGGRGSTVTRTCRATGETVLVPPRNRGSKADRITGATGKAIEGETAAARPVVAKKQGNACGAKGPCCTTSLIQHGRQG
jgi:hypothetical protein